MGYMQCAAHRREMIVPARLRRVLAGLVGLALALPAVSADAAGPGFTLKYEPNILSSPTLGPVPEGFASWRDVFVEQARLNAAALEIEADPTALAQLGGIIADPTARRLQVFWKGGIPAQTEALFAKLRREVPIDVASANYSAQELRLAAHRLVRDGRVVRVHGGVDGRELHVMLAEDIPAEARAAVLREVRGMRLSASSGTIPMDFTYGTPAVPVHSRDATASPAFAGARIFHDYNTNQGCTLGFGVKKKNGTRGWLTALHCRPPDHQYYSVFAGSPGKDHAGSLVLGKYTDASSSGHDMAFISPASGVSVGSFVYVGRPFGQDAAVPVAGSAKSFVGNFVFSSGSTTGLTGALKVRETGVAYDQGVDLTYARHVQSNGVGTARGDSGGPVIAFWPDGRAGALGVALRHDSDFLPCPSQYQSGGRGSCTRGVYYGEFTTAASLFGVSVLTGVWP